MKNNKELFQSSQFITHKALEIIFKNYLVEKETLLMSFKLTIGRTSIAKINCTHNEGIVSIKPYFDNEFIIRDFLNIFLPVISNLGNTKNAIKGKTLNSKSIGSLLIPLPPLEEQERIIEIINSLNVFIDEYSFLENYLQKLEEEFPFNLKKSILNYAMNGKLVKQDENDSSINDLLKQIYREKQEIIKQNRSKEFELENSIIYKNASDNSYYENSDNLLQVRLGDISTIYTGNSISKIQKDRFFKNVKGLSYIATKDVNFNKIVDYSNGVSITEDKISEFKIAPKGSILLCVEGGSAGRKIALIDRDVAFGNKLCCINSNFICNKFIFYYLQSNLFLDTFYKQMTGIIQGINLSTLREIKIPLFSTLHQEFIIDKLTAIDKLISKLNLN
ncbi:restriction endonuclease subunit S [Mycoplasma capricolum]|uniref:restriction endonuclease subunit S n=1 Tax=Mycoplasma capricolum TaxID=2095 RepID=UPI003DA4BAC4